MKESTKLFYFNLLRRYSFFIKTHIKLFFFILFFPYIISMALCMFFKNNIIFFMSIVSIVILVIPIIFNSNGIYFIDDEKDKYKKIYFSSKWLNRGSGQYVFITPINDFRLIMYVYNTKKRNFLWEEELFTIHKIESYWGDWDLSNTIHASQKDINKYNLNVIAAQILLSIE